MWIQGLLFTFVFCFYGFHVADASDFIFGPEFTFSNANILDDRRPEKVDGDYTYVFTADKMAQPRYLYLHNLIARLNDHLVHGQKGAAKFKYFGTTFSSPNGWSFTLKSDFGVVEVTMNPMSVEQFRQYQGDIQDAIFVSAANEGLFPFDYLGGGHINIGLEKFYENPMLLRNFIVDFFNHNELVMGVFSYDSNNAIPFSLLTPKTQWKMRQIIARFDRTFASRPNPRAAVQKLLRNLDDLMSVEADEYQEAWVEHFLRSKTHALNFSHALEASDSDRLEVRAVRPQQSMDVFVRQIELLRERLRYLETKAEPIPFKLETPLVVPQRPHTTHKLNPPVRPKDALKAFYQYVTESGLEWKDHTDYLWPQWIEDGEVERFERSHFFKRHEALRAKAKQCANLLQRGSP